MKKLFTSILSLTVASIVAQTPISLSNSNMPGSGDTLRYSNAKLNTLPTTYTQTGTNFNWDFSMLEPQSQGIRSYKLALQTPYAFFFLGLNEYGEKIADTLGAGPLTITNYYNFYKKQTSPAAFIADGAGMTLSMVPVPSYYSDKDELYKFPMTYPKYDSTTFKFSTATNSLIPIVYSKTGYRVTKCNGWGSITTPYGTANCLRIETTQYSKDSIKNNIFPLPLGFQNNQRSFQWLTTTSKIPFLEVNGNLIGNNFTVTQVRYRDIPRTINLLTSIQDNMDQLQPTVYPNPVKDKVYLNASVDISYELDIINMSGALLMRHTIHPSESGIAEIEMGSLSAGLYMFRINYQGQQYHFKFIKE